MELTLPAAATDFIPAAHHALNHARADERRAAADALGSANFVAVTGEPQVGKTSILERAFHELKGPRIRVDLDGAASQAHVSWFLARGIARQLITPPNLSLLAGAPDIAPVSARSELLMMQRLVGQDLAELALADVPSIDIGVDRALAAVEALAVERPVTVWVDHLETPGLTARHPVDASELLWSLRSLAQRTPFQTVASFRAASSRDIGGRDAAFHQDGRWLHIQRPPLKIWQRVCDDLDLPVRPAFLEDLVRLLERHPASILLALAEVAGSGAPARSVDRLVSTLASRDDGHAALTVQHARSLHRLGAEVLTQIAHGHRPYALPGLARRNDIQIAVGRLHRAGLVCQPGPREWQITNPLVAIRLRGMLRPLAGHDPEPLD